MEYNNNDNNDSNESNNPYGSNRPPQRPMPVFNVDMKKFFKGGSVVLVLLALLIIGAQSLYVVDQTEHAIKVRFNEIIEVNTNNLSDAEFIDLQEHSSYDNIKLTQGAGLKFKIPFIDTVEYFDNRLITYDTAPREVITVDQKKIILDNNAQWWITDPYKFKLTMNSITSANHRIEDLMYSKVNEKVGKTLAHDLIANKEYIDGMLEEISAELNVAMDEYGVTIADVRIKRTDLPPENNENIYNRMRTERVQLATMYRSEGREEATKIQAEADMEAQVLVSEAYAEAERIKGEGDAEAASIYNESYNKDPEFYEFYKSLETYRETLGSNSKIVIDPSSPFAKYIYSADGTTAPSAPATTTP